MCQFLFVKSNTMLSRRVAVVIIIVVVRLHRMVCGLCFDYAI